MPIAISQSEGKAFRKAVAAALKAHVSDLAASEDKTEALKIQQAIARNSVIFVESFNGYIESDWKKLAADVFLMDAKTTPDPLPTHDKQRTKKGKGK